MRPNILMGRYALGRMLGQGTFAKVYYATNLKTGDSVAIKTMDREKIVKIGVILVRHLNIVRLYEVMVSKSKIYFVMEYVKRGELFNQVVDQGALKEEGARKCFQQLISAVDFCHSRGVYHRDLKPDMKVSDFGLSALPEQFRQDSLLRTTCGTPAYVPPEIISNKGYGGAEADIWSCGVILFVLLAGYCSSEGANLMVMYNKICKGDYKCPPWFSSKVRRLVLRVFGP